ncbi:unnamed protein product [Prunus armeniaca]
MLSKPIPDKYLFICLVVSNSTVSSALIREELESLPKDLWQLHVDGASNHKGARAGVVIITLDGTLLKQAIRLGFPASNTKAEYEALLTGMHVAKEL